MWVFTEEGFFSAVQGKDGGTQIVVRARARDDLVRLLDRYCEPLKIERPIILDEGGDYPHRVVMDKYDWSEILASSAEHIDYCNFKDMIHETLGHERAHTYLRVWSALLDLEAKQCAECDNILHSYETVLCSPCIRFHVERAEALERSKALHPNSGKKGKKAKKQRKLRLA